MTRPVGLVVSPHLDDAVFSCPAWILDGVRAGLDVRVLSLFSGEGDAPTTRDEQLYRQRRREDELAVRELGATAIHGGLADAPFRSASYRRFEGIVFGPIDPSDRAPSDAQALIAREVDRLRPVALHGILGVGTHVDHRIAFDAVRAEQRRSPWLDVSFAEDRPYSMVRGALQVRLGQLGLGSPEAAVDAATYCAELRCAPYVRAHAAAAELEGLVSRARAQWEAAQAARIIGYAQFRTLTVSRQDATLALRAMQRYETQFQVFFGSEAQAQSSLGAEDSAGERSWSLERLRINS